jgi:hypothetical protein
MKTYTEKEIIAAYKKHIAYNRQNPKHAKDSLDKFLEQLTKEKKRCRQQS